MDKIELEKALMDADPQQILKLVEAMKKLALLVANEQVKKMLISKLSRRLDVIERLPVGKRQGIEGQDSDSDNKKLWPSLQGE